MAIEKDRESVGLTEETKAMLGDIKSRDWFPDGQDIGRFCMSYAIRVGIAEGSTGGTTTEWAAGNFDKNGDITALLAVLYPNCSTPVRLMEHLVNEGIKLVAQRIKSDAVGPAELMS